MRALSIASTWDGLPAHASEVVHLRLGPVAAGFALELDAPFHGDPPPSAPPGPTWGLWNHEVVEVFLLGDGERYAEVEVGPFGHHLVLRLHGRRNVVERGLPLDLHVEREAARWWARALLDTALVPEGSLRVNAYAVHGAGDGRRYLAWRPVPGERPDFHRLEVFGGLG